MDNVVTRLNIEEGIDGSRGRKADASAADLEPMQEFVVGHEREGSAGPGPDDKAAVEIGGLGTHAFAGGELAAEFVKALALAVVLREDSDRRACPDDLGERGDRLGGIA